MASDRTKATIYDVADRAGVAISTVSRVLNNSSDVSDATRERVLSAIRELQYRPDRTAKTLAAGEVHTLAVALPSFTTPFHTELLKGIRGVLHETERDLLLCDLGSRDRHIRLLKFLKRGTVAGLILVGVDVTSEIATELRALYSPVVLIGSSYQGFDSYRWDDAEGARVAVKHLIERGHRRIAMIRSMSNSPLQEQRISGYRRALEEAGIPYDDALVVTGITEKHAGYSEEAGFEAMESLISRRPAVTAVFASSDVQAIGAIKTLREAGLRIPEDIALVGYDDIKASAYIGLSSVDQAMQQIGRSATKRIIDRIEGRAEMSEPKSVDITPVLRIRASSDYSVRT
jgi:LacI family transcriptional regulator